MQDVPAQSQPNPQAMRPNRVLGSVKSSFASGGFFQATPTSGSGTTSSAVTDVIPASDLSAEEKMDLWSAVMDEVEQSSTEVMVDPLVGSVDQTLTPINQQDSQAQQPLQTVDNTFVQSQMAVQVANQPVAQAPVQQARPSSKESLSGTPTLEVGTAAAAIEYEKTNEISPEVESYIQKVEDHAEQLPQEVVIADGSVQLNPVQYAAQPVVVIPITEEIEQEGSKKNATFSIRWLVEWSHKVIKMFSGKTIYKQEK